MKKNIIKRLLVTPSKDGVGNVLIDKEGKVYFIDKRYSSTQSVLDAMSEGDSILTWVLSEKATIGFVRLDVRGLLIKDYINNVPTIGKEDYLNKTSSTNRDETHLYSQCHNEDESFEEFRISSIDLNELTEASVELSNHYRKYGYSEEVCEYRESLSIFHSWLLVTFKED